MRCSATSFDFAPYQRIPQVTLEAALALARALLDARPVGLSQQVDLAAAELGQQVAEVELTVGSQPPSSSPCPQAQGHDLELEGSGLDSLWETLRARLSTWQGFEHPDLDPIIDGGEAPLAQVLANGRAKAERARRYLELVFGAGGLRFLRGSECERLASMAAILGRIEAEGLAEGIDELAGPELLAALEGCQREHASRLGRPLLRVVDELPALDELRVDLHRTTTAYLIAVLGLVRLREPETFAPVHRALRPVLVLRTQLSEGRWLPGEEEERLVDDLFDEDFGPPQEAVAG
jgi:hypothetical protein